MCLLHAYCSIASIVIILTLPFAFLGQVTWAGFDKLEVDQSIFKRVLLLGYLNGFQVLDVEDASGISELASKRDGPVSFLQMQPFPIGSNGQEGLQKFHPLLLVVAGDDPNGASQNSNNLSGLGRESKVETQSGNGINSATAVRFYSLKSHSYVHVLRFRSMVCMIRCSSKIVAVGLATQVCSGSFRVFKILNSYSRALLLDKT